MDLALEAHKDQLSEAEYQANLKRLLTLQQSIDNPRLTLDSDRQVGVLLEQERKWIASHREASAELITLRTKDLESAKSDLVGCG